MKIEITFTAECLPKWQGNNSYWLQQYYTMLLRVRCWGSGQSKCWSQIIDSCHGSYLLLLIYCKENSKTKNTCYVWYCVVQENATIFCTRHNGLISSRCAVCKTLLHLMIMYCTTWKNIFFLSSLQSRSSFAMSDVANQSQWRYMPS